tara:strand:+ start:98 stop:526 length:429 start_codon:yes stop_codon:yes gene_type:complete
MSINDLLAGFYEDFFNWNNYEVLLTSLYDNNDYGKFGWLLLIVPLIMMLLFYKVWEPMRKQRLMWLITIITIAIVNYAITTGIIYSNVDVLNEIDIFDGSQVDPEFFVFEISMINALYTVLISLFYSIILKRFSTQNSHNPF